MPFAIGTIIGASQSDRLAARLGRTVLALGVAGIGSGLFIAPNTRFIVATLDRSEAGASNCTEPPAAGQGSRIAPVGSRRDRFSSSSTNSQRGFGSIRGRKRR